MGKSILLISLLIFFISCSEKSDNEEVDLFGCMDANSINFNSEAITDNGSCLYVGCTDSIAINYDSTASIDDGNCLFDESTMQGYTLFWNDEFNVDTLNLRYWNVEEMWPGAFNNESQSYEKNNDNITIINGKLYIRAKKENPFDPNNPAYTSGRINTKGKVELQYGYWEIKAMLPSGVGTWPAIRMFNSQIDSVSWPYCGEIDIMEHVGYNSNEVFFSIHNTNLYGNVGGTNQQGVYEMNDLETDFHRYAIDWGENFIRGYVDGNLYFNYNKGSSSFEDWPYDNPFFLIINLAIGGEWGGIEGIDNSAFPASFIIDYVRLYKKN